MANTFMLGYLGPYFGEIDAIEGDLIIRLGEGIGQFSTASSAGGDYAIMNKANHTFEIYRSGSLVAALGADGLVGPVKLSNDTFLEARNAADTADVDIIKVNTDDEIELGSAAVNIAELKLDSSWLLQSEAEGGVERLTIKGAGVNDAAELLLHPTGSANTSRFTITDNVNTTNYDGIAIEATTTENTIESIKNGTGTAQPIKLKMDSTDVLVIEQDDDVYIPNGNLGIGVSPTTALDVVGVIQNTGNVIAGGNVIIPNDTYIQGYDTLGGLLSLMKVDTSDEIVFGQKINGVDAEFTGTLTLTNGITEFSTDGTLVDDSDTAVPTEKAVKAYVDNSADSLPDQTGHSGDYLTTDGTDPSWTSSTVSAHDLTGVQHNFSGSVGDVLKIAVGPALELSALDFSELGVTPTDLAGYGITDALSTSHDVVQSSSDLLLWSTPGGASPVAPAFNTPATLGLVESSSLGTAAYDDAGDFAPSSHVGSNGSSEHLAASGTASGNDSGFMTPTMVDNLTAATAHKNTTTGNPHNIAYTDLDGSLPEHNNTYHSVNYVSETTFNDHDSRHENGGGDEINVAGLNGVLADDQPAKAHDLVGTKHNVTGTAGQMVRVDATLGLEWITLTYSDVGAASSGHDHDTDYAPLSHVGSGGSAHSLAVAGASPGGGTDGFMSGDDKYYLDDLIGHNHDATYLNESSNLSDLDSAVTARANLGLGSAAVRDESFFALDGHVHAYSEISGTHGNEDHSSTFSVDGHNHSASDITSGTLGIARGGTNRSSYSVNDNFIVYNSGSLVQSSFSDSSFASATDLSDHIGAGGTSEHPLTSVSQAGFMSVAHRTKLNNIEDEADVTDATNVEAAGALMASGGVTEVVYTGSDTDMTFTDGQLTATAPH